MRVGILTSGGDCQALNATMRGLALTLYSNTTDVAVSMTTTITVWLQSR